MFDLTLVAWIVHPLGRCSNNSSGSLAGPLSCRTIEETCAEFDHTARTHGEKVSLSARQLSRWLSGRTSLARPIAQRVALLHWGYDFEQLVGQPMSPFPTQTWHPELSHSGQAVDWPMWFGMQLTSLIATVDGLTGQAVVGDGLQARLNKEVLMFDIDTSATDPAYAISRRQALIAVAAFPLATAAKGLTDPALFLSRCAVSLAACWHLLAGSDLRAVSHAISSYLPDLEVVARPRVDTSGYGCRARRASPPDLRDRGVASRPACSA